METEKIIIKQNVGIDLAKDSFAVSFCVKTTTGSVITKGSRTFTNDGKGIKEFAEWATKKSVKELPVLFTMEATGVYYETLAYYLVDQACQVHVVLPNVAKKYAQSLGQKSKTDKIDAYILAQMGLERNLQIWKPISPNFRILKQLTRERDALVCDRTDALNQLHAHSHQFKPYQATIKRLKKHIVFLEKQIKEIEQEIEKTVKQDKELERRLSFIESIKGVGLLTAVIVVAETNGFASVTSIKQLTSYAGLDVKIAESGKWKGKSRISKRGNKYIRKALYMPVFSKIKHHQETRRFYERLCHETGVKMMAVVAVQRKLLGLMYTLWKKEEMFCDAA